VVYKVVSVLLNTKYWFTCGLHPVYMDQKYNRLYISCLQRLVYKVYNVYNFK